MTYSEHYEKPKVPVRMPIKDIADIYELRADNLLTAEESSRLVSVLERFGPFVIVGARLEFPGGRELRFFS